VIATLAAAGCGSAKKASTPKHYECSSAEKEAKPLACEEREKQEARRNPSSSAGCLENAKIASEAETRAGTNENESEDSDEKYARAQEEIRKERGLPPAGNCEGK
jgi:hypothetical protein